jgi:hypothetical protein
LGNHKSEAYARVGFEVRIGLDVGVEVVNCIEVLEFEVKLLNIVFYLPLKYLSEVVYSCILDVVGWTDDADDR